jgi:hypothetical protein
MNSIEHVEHLGSKLNLSGRAHAERPRQSDVDIETARSHHAVVLQIAELAARRIPEWGRIQPAVSLLYIYVVADLVGTLVGLAVERTIVALG